MFSAFHNIIRIYYRELIRDRAPLDSGLSLKEAEDHGLGTKMPELPDTKVWQH